jgi:hypothetical protein
MLREFFCEAWRMSGGRGGGHYFGQCRTRGGAVWKSIIWPDILCEWPQDGFEICKTNVLQQTLQLPELLDFQLLDFVMDFVM